MNENSVMIPELEFAPPHTVESSWYIYPVTGQDVEIKSVSNENRFSYVALSIGGKEQSVLDYNNFIAMLSIFNTILTDIKNNEKNCSIIV